MLPIVVLLDQFEIQQDKKKMLKKLRSLLCQSEGEDCTVHLVNVAHCRIVFSHLQ